MATATRNATNSSRRGNNRPKCATCKTPCRDFIPVFLDLGGGGEGSVACAGGNDGGGAQGIAQGDGAIAIDNVQDHDNELEELTEEWDGLWNELKKLCGYIEEAHSGANESNDRVGGGVVDMTDSSSSHHASASDRYVADICAMIDLTQNSPQRPTTTQSQQTVSLSSEEKQPSLETKLSEFDANRERIQQILHRLKALHTKMLTISQESALQQQGSSSSSASNQKLQRYKTKIFHLQDAKATLTSQNHALQSTNEQITARITAVEQTALDRTIETERARRKVETLQTQFISMEDSYKKYSTKTKLEKEGLQSKIHKLQSEYSKLSTQIGLENAQEMDEIRVKYGKMTQELHNAKSRNGKIANICERRERELEVKLSREQKEVVKLKKRLDEMMELVAENNGMDIDMEQMAKKRAVGGATATSSSSSVIKLSSSSGKTRGDDSGDNKELSSYAIHQSIAAAARIGNQKHSSSNKSGQKRSTTSKAMNALDKASARRFPKNLKQQPQRPHLKQQPVQQSSRHSASNDQSTGGVQLMMRAKSKSSKKPRHGSIGSSSSRRSGLIFGEENNIQESSPPEHSFRVAATASISSAASLSSNKSNRVSASWSHQGGNTISSFFRPLGNNAGDSD